MVLCPTPSNTIRAAARGRFRNRKSFQKPDSHPSLLFETSQGLFLTYTLEAKLFNPAFSVRLLPTPTPTPCTGRRKPLLRLQRLPAAL